MGFTPRVTAVRAGGVRLRGRIVDGKLLLGELDKFRDPESTAPFNLPDIKLSLQDARMRLDTPMGPVGLKIDGSGHLQDRFAGKLAAVMPSAAFGGCRAKGVTLYADRKSVGEGTGVSVRVDLGGRRIIKKKKT